MEVKAFKMTNDGDIFCENITDHGNGTSTLKSAIYIVAQPNQQGGVSVRLIPMTIFSKSAAKGMDVTIRNDSIYFSYDPEQELKNMYIQMRTGIQPAGQKPILTVI